jgi:hypothetical protein
VLVARVPTNPARFRPDGPTRLTSRAYALDLADSTVRTLAQTESARFWSENTFQQWGRKLRTLAATRHLDVADSARLLAMVHTATAHLADGAAPTQPLSRDSSLGSIISHAWRPRSAVPGGCGPSRTTSRVPPSSSWNSSRRFDGQAPA